jgi:hypothetical protein
LLQACRVNWQQDEMLMLLNPGTGQGDCSRCVLSSPQGDCFTIVYKG